jgi:hypothetical protein
MSYKMRFGIEFQIGEICSSWHNVTTIQCATVCKVCIEITVGPGEAGSSEIRVLNSASNAPANLVFTQPNLN